MKKVIGLMLCLMLVLSVFGGCAGESTETTGTPELNHVLKVGFGRTDISPTESVPLRGYGDTLTRMSTSVTERLYATCVAFTDESDNTVLIFHLDLCNSDFCYA